MCNFDFFALTAIGIKEKFLNFDYSAWTDINLRFSLNRLHFWFRGNSDSVFDCHCDWRRSSRCLTLRLSIQPQKGCNLREDISIHRTNLKYCGKAPKIRFTPTFIFCSPICPNICDFVVLWKYILVFEKWFFSFDLSNMQIFTVDITRVVWPHVTNILDLRYFCQRNPLFYHLNLIPCHYWSWQRNIYFLVNIFVRHTLPMSKSNIKTKTDLAMTDVTKSIELRAF